MLDLTHHRKIGEGAYSTVFECNRLVIKRIHKIVFRQQEVEILKELKHPSIITFVSSFADESYVYIEFEYFPSKNLYEWRTDGTILKDEQILEKIVNQLAEVVKYIHSANVVHGDLSVRNVLVNFKNDIKLIDFGNSYKEGKYIDINCYGTFAYLPPEILSGEVKTINQTSDLWALGMLIFVVLTSNIPFSGHTEKTIYSRIINQKISYKNVPKKYKKLLKNLLHKKYCKRKIITEKSSLQEIL